MAEKRIYRRVTEADKEKVLKINDNIYDGRDYLPDLFDDLINDDNMRGYVCEENGELVGFFMAHIVDGGETILRRAGRVRRDREGQGIFRNILEYMMKDCSTIPTVKETAITIPETSVEKMEDFLKRGHYVQFTETQFFFYEFNLNELNTDRLKKPVDSESIKFKEVDRSRMLSIFKNRKLRDHYFQDGIVSIHCLPLKAIEANFQYIFSKRTYILESVKEGDDADESEARLLSIGSFFPCKRGLAYQLDIYGNKANDFALHLSSHSQRMATMTNNDFITSGIMMPDSVDSETVNKVFTMLGISRKPAPLTKVLAFSKKL